MGHDKTKRGLALRSEELAADLEAQRAEQAAAEREQVELQAARSGMILTASDDQLEAHDRKIAKAGRRIERAAALQAKLAPEIEAAAAAEEQGRREAAYDSAKRAAVEYRRLVEKDYPIVAGKLVALMEEMVRQHTLASAANDALPEGREPIDANGFRQEPPEPPEEPEYVDKKIWIGPDGERYQSAPLFYNGKAPHGCTVETVRVRAFKMPVMSIATPRRPGIEAAVFLPGVAHDDPHIWGKTR